jgi:hypothetical protein
MGCRRAQGWRSASSGTPMFVAVSFPGNQKCCYYLKRNVALMATENNYNHVVLSVNKKDLQQKKMQLEHKMRLRRHGGERLFIEFCTSVHGHGTKIRNLTET